MTQGNNNRSMLKTTILILIIAVVIIGGYSFLNAPDNRGIGERFDDAANEMSDGIDEAAEEFQDRTPAERLGDAVEDAGDDFQRATEQ